jgi:hypothetical protein
MLFNCGAGFNADVQKRKNHVFQIARNLPAMRSARNSGTHGVFLGCAACEIFENKFEINIVNVCWLMYNIFEEHGRLLQLR